MAQNSTLPTSSSLSSRPIYSCIRCSDRKVRCDKQNPCNTCVKHNVQCLFRTPAPPRRKQKLPRDGTLKAKVKRYEALLQDLGVNPNEMPKTPEAEQRHTQVSDPKATTTKDASQLPTPASTASELEQAITTSQLLHGQGKSKFLDNLWSSMVQEFHDPEEALDGSSCEESDAKESDDDLGFVLGVSRKPGNGYSHPPTEHVHQLWQVFIENIDPLTKIVHVPSLQLAIQKATTDIQNIPRSFEALMFAIYAAAVMSLKDDDCKRRLGESRSTLFSHYTSATKSALSRAKFMETMSIVVLQALVIHIFTVRNVYGPRTVWTLTGVAIRIAEGMGLHCDGASLGVPPFEAEIRRRIWWLLKMHDIRAAELGGLAKFRGLNSDYHTCELPANINDNELYPGMSSPPPSSSKLTDMMFPVLGAELTNFARRYTTNVHQQEKDAHRSNHIDALSGQRTQDELIKDVEDILEAKYIRYCDPSQPLQLVTMLMARFAINIIRFQTHHPRRWAFQEQVPESEQQCVWKISIALLEQHEMLLSDRRLQGYTWCTVYFLPWHALIHVLDTLRAKPLILDAEKTWRLIEAIYEHDPDMISNTKKRIHVAVGNLCMSAFNAREAALVRDGRSVPYEPEYIRMLRQQREAAKAKRKTRESKSKEAKPVPSYTLSQVNNMTRKLDPRVLSSKNGVNDDDPRPELPQLTNSNETSESDPFWLSSGLDDGLYGSSADMMNIETDFMLAQDYDFPDASGQTISWTQWDTWLGELNVAPANSNTG